jgi:valyl-tRNA synthetase
MADMIDTEKERVRLAGEIKKTEGEIARLNGKLSNEGFLAKAPAQVVEGEKAKLEKYQATLEALKAALAKIG